MIDLSNFKKINDSYGHEAGDKCLRVFASILNRYFVGDLVFRLHGDEFAIITSRDEEEAFDIFECAMENINSAATAGDIPLPFGFNAGSSRLERNLRVTMDKADYMMYKAKKDGNKYQPYSNVLYREKLENLGVLSDIRDHIDDDNFSYFGRKLYNKNDEEENLIQIYTKDRNGGNIFGGTSYDILRENSTISRFDKNNVEKLIGHIKEINRDYLYFVSVDYRSLFSIRTLTPQVRKIDRDLIDHIVISIDVEGMEFSEYPLIIEIIVQLKYLGFKIRLDKVSNKMAYYFMEETNPNYIKISTQDWKVAFVDNYKSKILVSSMALMKSIKSDTRLIFEMIENKEEKDYLKSIAYNDSLFSGNFYSYEKKLTLK